MPPKRKSTPLPAGSSTEKQQKAIDLDMIMKISKDYKVGKKVKVIADGMKLAHSTISTILKDKVRVKEAVKASTGFKSNHHKTAEWAHSRDGKGAGNLVWRPDSQKKFPLSLLTIQAKARSIFATLKEQQEEESTEMFTASPGWFQRFRSRFNLHNRGISGEVASADIEGAENFIQDFDKYIQYTILVYRPICLPTWSLERNLVVK